MNYLVIPCCLIKLTHHIKGFILINNNNPNYFEFFSSKEGGKDKIDSITKLCYGSFNNMDNNKSYYIKIFINEINIIFERKYFYLNNSIEIFTNKNKSYYFNLGIEMDIKEEEIDNKTKFIKLIKPKFANIEISSILKYNNLKNNENKNKEKIYLAPELVNNYIDLSTKWVNGKISTFTFLNILNILSNRSLKDLTQYPIFPWIIHDNLIKTQNEYLKIRELNKPMGIITLDSSKNENRRLKHYIENYKSFIDELDKKYKHYKMENFYNDDDISYDDIPYIYGTHYSNPAYVSHYLNRNFPYTFIA